MHLTTFVDDVAVRSSGKSICSLRAFKIVKIGFSQVLKTRIF